LGSWGVAGRRPAAWRLGDPETCDLRLGDPEAWRVWGLVRLCLCLFLCVWRGSGVGGGLRVRGRVRVRVRCGSVSVSSCGACECVRAGACSWAVDREGCFLVGKGRGFLRGRVGCGKVIGKGKT
jgi:hypothetical protein